MTPTVHVLMSVYNEAAFVDYALRACAPYVKSVTVVEGAYRETIALGASPRSNDGTLKILASHASDKVHIIHANEKSDKDQRNVGLERIKQLDPLGWLLIIDGDEVYQPFTFKLVNALTRKMERSGHECAIFKSLTFVNDFNHYCDQFFPRLFQVRPNAKFVNDNALQYLRKYSADYPKTIQCPYVEYHHYSFLKGPVRFSLKKLWWETRFGKQFDYSWNMGEDGKIRDPNHTIKEYRGRHPDIMRDRIEA